MHFFLPIPSRCIALCHLEMLECPQIRNQGVELGKQHLVEIYCNAGYWMNAERIFGFGLLGNLDFQC